MNIIQPSFEIWERDEQRGGLAIIERAGRICYKSEPGNTPESAEKLTRGLIKRHHNSVLEHGDMIFEIGDYHIYENVANALQWIRDTGEQPPMLEMTRICGRCIISGNIRAWRELFASGSGAGLYFIAWFDPVFVDGYGFYGDDAASISKDPNIRQIFYKDLHEPGEMRAHLRQTVHFTCDRAIQNEFVRHRTASFSVESSRYCDYSSDKHGYGITVIEPFYLQGKQEDYGVWKRQCMSADVAYLQHRRDGLKPEEARAVLPLCTKTEVVMTGNLRAWDHFFAMRARQSTGPAHPQAVELAAPLMGEMVLKYPDALRW